MSIFIEVIFKIIGISLNFFLAQKARKEKAAEQLKNFKNKFTKEGRRAASLKLKYSELKKKLRKKHGKNGS